MSEEIVPPQDDEEPLVDEKILEKKEKKPWSKKRQWFWRILLWSPLIFLLTSNLWIEYGYNHRVFQNTQDIEKRPVALVLGTAKTFMGFPNPYYQHRIKAALDLYKSGKIRGIVVSGDNSLTTYDEPTDMKNDLVRRGVPEEFITMDFAGFRTLDSVVRMGKVFQQTSYIIVSQRFHCQRALFIAHMYGHDALAYEATDVAVNAGGARVHMREYAARTKALLDIITFKRPYFLGEYEKVNLRP